MCFSLAITTREVCVAFGNEMFPMFGEYWKTRWRVVNFTCMTLRVSQPFLESMNVVVVETDTELVEISTLIHPYIELFWLFVEIKTIYFLDLSYWSI